jgi:hypothetical protein
LASYSGTFLLLYRDGSGYKFEKVPPFPTYIPSLHGPPKGVIADSFWRATTRKPVVYDEGEEMIPGSKEYKNYIETVILLEGVFSNNCRLILFVHQQIY